MSYKDDMDNRSNQLNPNNENYQGGDDEYDDEDYEYSQADLDNHANQLNPNHDEYRGSSKN